MSEEYFDFAGEKRRVLKKIINGNCTIVFIEQIDAIDDLSELYRGMAELLYKHATSGNK